MESQKDVLMHEIAQKKVALAVLEAKLRGMEQALLANPVLGSHDNYWRIETNSFGDFEIKSCVARSILAANHTHGNAFQSESMANSFADALKALLILRHQPGTCASFEDVQWVIEPYQASHRLNDIRVTVKACLPTWVKASKLSPCFSSRESAEQAIAKITEARLLRMFCTFAQVEIRP